MHIKQVLISGFRSFRSQNEIETFSSKHNVIVGRNGSGKSNFFDAIQFVLLGPKFATLRQEDRQHLLHEGAGSGVLAAYVEIVFDNSDGRLSVESEEVILRRTVGHKKDEFFLNRKRVQKSEVMSLLESAGFSKSNPYYIVQQGKVANLCLMKDKDRLNLLKEVAGTTVYEERRAESTKIMHDTAQKKEKVEEVLTFIEERLDELEQEKRELSEYEQLDKQRRALEFSLYDKEYQKASDQLQQMDSVHEDERERQHGLYTNLNEVQDELTSEDDALTTAQLALERISARRGTKHTEIQETIGKVSALEVEIQEAEAGAKADSAERAQWEEQLAEIAQQVAETEQQLAEVNPQHAEQTASLNELRSALSHAESRSEALYGKQGRGVQFHTKAERDAFLQTQIDSLVRQVEEKTALLARSEEEVSNEEARVRQEEQDIQAAEQQSAASIQRSEQVRDLIRAATTRRNELQEQRKSSWRGLETFQEQSQETRQELERAKQQLNRALPRHIAQGLQAVEAIVAEHNVQGYYGTLIDNITLRADAFRSAIEVAAGNALFHVVVDTDTTAAFLINELDRRKAGRLTFLPLNRLHNPTIHYPDSNDVRPLMAVALTYESHLEVAVKQVFGHKLLARDLDVAARFSKECGLDAITKEGDQVNRKGGFEGGFHDEKASRIGAVYKIREANAALQELAGKEAALQAQSEQAETQVNEAMRELQQLETEKAHLRQTSDQLARELKNRSKQIYVTRTGLEDQKRGLGALKAQITLASQQVEAYRAEQLTELESKLSDEERAELQALEEQQRTLQVQLDALEADVIAVTTTRDRLAADLSENLLKRKEEVERMLLSDAGTGAGGGGAAGGGRDGGGRDFEAELSSLQLNREHMVSVLKTAEVELKDMDGAVQSKRKEVDELEKAVEERRGEEQALQEKIAEAIKMLDKLLNKRSMLLETVHSRQRLMRDLGTLPRREMDELHKLSEKQLMGRLKKVNEQLKQYSSVNRKALDQYVSFNEQRETLMQRKEEMDRDSGSIQQLIESLDEQKDEAILRTFHGVSEHFEEVFSELVPGGKGQLVMRTTLDQTETAASSSSSSSSSSSEAVEDANVGNDEDEGAVLSKEGEEGGEAITTRSAMGAMTEAGASATVNTFQGVQVRVSFSGTGQQYHMQQLSGGQKALVALALIFAIQRCDPAPFYLFDEIDQALDANYRAGVARLIQKQVASETAPAQFITTTFRPELVAAADRCFGIALMSKVSNIHPLEKVDAQNFVTNLMIEEEAVGQVSAVPTVKGSRSRNSNAAGSNGGSSSNSKGSSSGVADTGAGAVAGHEELKSPSSKIRRLRQRQHASSSAGASPGEEEEEEEEMEEEEGQEGGGLVELDGEEEAAFANLGLHDIQPGEE